MTSQFFARPLRFEPDGHDQGPAIVDANGRLVASFYWPVHEPEETDAAVGALYLIATRAVNAANGTDDGDEGVYQLGKRDGYMDAVQELDQETGGDGEFKGSTLPGGTVDVPVMFNRIVERFDALSAERARVIDEASTWILGLEAAIRECIDFIESDMAEMAVYETERVLEDPTILERRPSFLPPVRPAIRALGQQDTGGADDA